MKQKNYTSIDGLINKSKEKDIGIPAGGLSKESGPVVTKQESAPEMKEVVEHEPEPEVKTYVQPRSESIELPPDLKKFGLQPVTHTQFPSYQNIKLPIPDEKIVVGLHAPITSSLRWLATLAVYLLKLAHLSLKVVHGKVVRVLKP